MNKSVITYHSHDTFYFGIKKLTELGLIFEADHDDLKIVLTGAY